MITEMDKLLDEKNTFLEAVAKTDQIAEQTVEVATQGIPMLQEASDELWKVVQEPEGADAMGGGFIRFQGLF